MELAKIAISGNQARALETGCITSGTIGATVGVQFDETWDGMAKTYVWRRGNVTKDDALATGNVPAELLEKPWEHLHFGVYGTREGTATPTIWADLGMIVPGVDPSGDETTDSSLPVWAQMRDALSFAPYIATAQAGQSVIAAEVDGSGKPTKWGAGGLADAEADSLMAALQ